MAIQIEEHLARLKQENIQIDTIVTFDEHGVSSHPNHTSCYHGVVKLLETHRLKAYKLVSTDVLRKYSFYIDIITNYFFGS